MKKIQIILSMIVLLGFFAACSTDVELYADYKDIPVVYGLLDASQDTNFIRINRAFSGNNEHPINANEVALIMDSCNYPGKLNAYIVKYRIGYGNSLQATGDTLKLDTITIHDKQEGVFYSPNQKVYFTDESLVDNTNLKYKFKLFVVKGNDTITAETNLVGGENFKFLTSQLSFSPVISDETRKIMFIAADNAVFYDLSFVFYYQESINGGPLIDKQVSYSLGAKRLDELGKDGEKYFFTYSENLLFNMLENAIGGDTIVNPNHPNVVRYFDDTPILLSLAAGGDELFNYIQINSQTGFSQTIPDYTNVMGGYGVFSSRINLDKTVSISSTAQRGLYSKPWGFVEQ